MDETNKRNERRHTSRRRRWEGEGDGWPRPGGEREGGRGVIEVGWEGERREEWASRRRRGRRRGQGRGHFRYLGVWLGVYREFWAVLGLIKVFRRAWGWLGI